MNKTFKWSLTGPTVANEPRKSIAIRLDSRSRAVIDPVTEVFFSVIRQTI